MKLLVMLITLAAEHFFSDVVAKARGYRRWDWLHTLVALMEKNLGDSVKAINGPAGVAAVLAVPVLALFFIGSFLKGVALLLGFMLSIAVLFLCLGPRDLNSDLIGLRNAITDNDEHCIATYTQGLTGGEGRGKAGAEAILADANDRLFAVIFWFMLLGPAGALIFRATSELRLYGAKTGSALGNSAKDLYRILIWLPGRLLAVCYGLAGSLGKSAQTWRFHETLSLDETEQVIKTSGLAALQYDTVASETEGLNAIRSLLERALLIWVVVTIIVAVLI